MSAGIVARRYARAFFAVGKREGESSLEDMAADLRLLRSALEASPALARFCKSPAFSPAEKEKLSAALADKYGLRARVRNFCRFLARKNRLYALPGIAAEFEAMLDTEKGVLRGELITAVELDARGRESVLRELKKRNDGLRLTYAVDAGLLGGALLKVGDKVLDACLRTRLSILKEQITRGE